MEEENLYLSELTEDFRRAMSAARVQCSQPYDTGKNVSSALRLVSSILRVQCSQPYDTGKNCTRSRPDTAGASLLFCKCLNKCPHPKCFDRTCVGACRACTVPGTDRVFMHPELRDVDPHADAEKEKEKTA